MVHLSGHDRSRLMLLPEALDDYVGPDNPSVAALGMISASGAPVFAQETPTWNKTFPQSDRVEHQKVSFTNRYGITSVGDLYLPRDRADERWPSPARSAP